jgi:hypothetical protein
MRSYPLCELSEFAVADGLCCQLRGKLALPARANTKDDVPTRNREGNLSAKISLDHRKREVHSCGYACRRPDAAILDMDGITVDEHRRTKAFQGVDLAPMSCSPSAIQRSGSGQEERAATHRCDAWHSVERSDYELCYGSTRKLSAHSRLTPDRDECIGASKSLIRDLSERCIGDKLNA